jgi:Ca-activated chloride channel family protein
MSKLFAVCLGIAVALSPGPATAQQAPYVYRVATHLIEVPVTVFDPHGHYVDGLDKTAFQILENGHPQKIKYFENNAESISCAVLLDTTGSMQSALPRLKNSVVRLIDQLGADDSVAIYSFSENLVTQQELTKDKAAAKRSILRLRAGGNTAFYDALSETAQEIGKQPGKKAIVVLTDGDDNASVLNAQSAVRRAIKSGVPLFTIAEGEAATSPKLKKTLADLSKSTGGESFEIKNLADMEMVFQKIAGELRHIYLLTYDQPTEPDDGKWRTIDIKTEQAKEFRLRSKEGYLPN